MSRIEIIPAIIGEEFAQVNEKIEQVKGLVNWVQIDVVDGRFAEPASWGSHIGDNLHLWEPTELPKIEMHLMIERPSAWFSDWASTSVDRVLIHYESNGDKRALIQEAKKLGTQVGLVLKYETPIDVIDDYVKELNVVQLMSIGSIGSYGAVFEEGVYEKISSIRKKYPDVTIEIDGGVNLENAKKLVEAGANNLVIGSAIFKSENVEEAIKEFRKII